MYSNTLAHAVSTGPLAKDTFQLVSLITVQPKTEAVQTISETSSAKGTACKRKEAPCYQCTWNSISYTPAALMFWIIDCSFIYCYFYFIVFNCLILLLLFIVTTVRVLNPALDRRCPKSDTATNGDTWGENPPSLSSSASCKEQRSSYRVSPPNIAPMKTPSGLRTWWIYNTEGERKYCAVSIN